FLALLRQIRKPFDQRQLLVAQIRKRRELCVELLDLGLETFEALERVLRLKELLLQPIQLELKALDLRRVAVFPLNLCETLPDGGGRRWLVRSHLIDELGKAAFDPRACRTQLGGPLGRYGGRRQRSAQQEELLEEPLFRQPEVVQQLGSWRLCRHRDES